MMPKTRRGRRNGGILGRFGRSNGANEKNRVSGGSGSSNGSTDDDDDVRSTRRKIFFNIPLPDGAKDEHGRPLAYYERNKIRTARYTPVSFVPKNLWFQFHNIATVYFVFLIILGDRRMPMSPERTLCD